MFVHDSALKKIDARPSDVITLLISTNRPMVALSGPPQQADAFIVSIGRGKTQPVYLCFHIIKEGQRLIYTSNTVPTSEPARTKLEQEALRFTEEMGFMMVRERFDELSSRQRDVTIMALAPFVDDLSEIARDEKPTRKQRKDRETRVAESETEYEEVYEEEEVEEEIPAEEEPAKPEEYESLSDVVTEVSAQETPRPVADDSAQIKRHEAPPQDTQTAPADEESFDLGEELSDMVQTIGEIPENARRVQENVVEPPKKPEPTPRRPKQAEPVTPAPRGVPTERRQAIIKLLISL